MMSFTRKANFCRPFEIYFGTCPKSNEKSFKDFKRGDMVRFSSWKVHNIQALELRT